MLKLNGYLLGADVREGEDRVTSDGREYRSDDRYKVCLGAGDMTLPDYYDCASKAVMDSIKSGARYGQQIELSARRDRYGRLIVTGFSAPSAARAS